MKRKISTILLCLLTFSLWVIPVANAKSYTVEDYYYLLPSKYLGISGLDSKEKKKDGIKTLDIKNDFIKIGTPDWDGSAEIAIFRAKGGDDLISVSNEGCGPMCEQNFYLLKYKNAKWQDVTKKLLPKIDDKKAEKSVIAHLKKIKNYDPEVFSFNPLLQIPQIGTTIKYFDQFSGTVVYELQWKKDHFILQTCNETTHICKDIAY